MTSSNTLDTIAVLDEKDDGLSSMTLPEDWKMFVHPHGSIYFSNGRIVVDQDVRQPETLESIIRCALDLGVDEWPEDNNVQVQLSVNRECNFALIINHTHCIAAHDYEETTDQAFLSMDPAKLNRLRRLYWNFLWSHSAHLSSCPQRAVPDACDALAWFYTDNLISGSGSLVPFSKQECEELLRRVKEFELPCYDNSAAKVAFLAWLLREICSFRDAEMYGQLSRKELADRRHNTSKAPLSTRPAPILLPFLRFLMAVVFFGIPHTYMRLVKQSFEYRGRLAGMQANWETYIERLGREYSNFLLISTVLLSATMGILAIPNISAVVELAALASAFSSLGSIIVGVFAIWRHQAKFRATDSFTYMRNAQHNLFGFHGHAILLSLPPVLLVWAIVTFTISILAYALDSLGNHDTGDRIAVAVIIVIFFCILTAVIAALYTLTMIWTYSHSDFWWTRVQRKFRCLTWRSAKGKIECIA